MASTSKTAGSARARTPARTGHAAGRSSSGAPGKRGTAPRGKPVTSATEPAVVARPTGTSPGEEQTPQVVRPQLNMAATQLRRLQQPLTGAFRAAERQARSPIDTVQRAVERVPRKQLFLYAGLGAAAVVSVIDWPVALAVAAASEVARRSAQREPAPQETPASPAARAGGRSAT